MRSGTEATELETCPGCRLQRPSLDGATDPYGGASASCWALFGEVCAKNYGEFRDPDVQQLIVDAYMAQHPAFATPAGRRSVAVHLVGLYCSIEESSPSREVIRTIATVFPTKRDVLPFEPIPSLGELDIAFVHAAEDREERGARANLWARAVWRAWAAHHARVRRLRRGEEP